MSVLEDMRLLGIVFAVGTIGLGYAALSETSSVQAEDRVVAEQAAATEAARDHEAAQRTRVASAIVHASGPLPFGMVPGAPAAEDDRCPDRPNPDELRDDGCPDPAILDVDGRKGNLPNVQLDVEIETPPSPEPLQIDERVIRW